MTAAEEILLAAQQGNVDRVQKLLAGDRALVNVKGEYDKTPLHWAAEKNHLQLAKVLLAGGADISAETTWGSTPLQWAANMGSGEVADLLLKNGALPQLNMWAAAGLGMLDVVQSFFLSPGKLKPNAGQTRSRKLANGQWGKTPPPESCWKKERTSTVAASSARRGFTGRPSTATRRWSSSSSRAARISNCATKSSVLPRWAGPSKAGRKKLPPYLKSGV
jgi:Ankyrin repeats (3 copies)